MTRLLVKKDKEESMVLEPYYKFIIDNCINPSLVSPLTCPKQILKTLKLLNLIKPRDFETSLLEDLGLKFSQNRLICEEINLFCE